MVKTTATCRPPAFDISICLRCLRQQEDAIDDSPEGTVGHALHAIFDDSADAWRAKPGAGAVQDKNIALEEFCLVQLPKSMPPETGLHLREACCGGRLD